MKLLLSLIAIILLNTSPASAYIDDNDPDDAETLAGDQNTNLYYLNNQGTISVKKLKQVDELIRRRESAGKSVDTSDIEALLNDEKKDNDKKELEIVLETLENHLNNPKQFKIVSTPDLYKQLPEISKNNIKDKEIALKLFSELKTRRKK